MKVIEINFAAHFFFFVYCKLFKTFIFKRQLRQEKLIDVDQQRLFIYLTVVGLAI